MTAPKIEVVMRMCPDSASPVSGGGRPSWFSKEAILKNLLETKDADVNIHVLFDGKTDEHWIRKYPVNLYEISAGNNDASFLTQLQFIQSNQFSDETIIYVLEDDYIHRSGWATLLREAFYGQKMPTFMKFDYVTLYDHRDKYTYAMYDKLVSKIAHTDTVHWRTVPSTTNTFAMLGKTFKEDFDVHWSFCNSDNEKFLTLGRQGRIIVSSIPGYSTHSHPEHLSPCIDWSSFLK
jgi:hypothetical protein